MSYCDPSDLYKFGLPPGGFSLPARLVHDIAGATVTAILTLDGHGLALNDPIRFRAEGGGILPTGIIGGTVYYAIPLTSSTFSVAAASGGVARNLTPPVTSALLVRDPPEQEWCDWASAMCDSFMPAHVVPLARDSNGEYPVIVVATAADLAVCRGLQWTGTGSVNLADKLKNAQAMLDRWSKGVPLRGQGASAQVSSNLAITRSAGRVDPRGWDGGNAGRIP